MRLHLLVTAAALMGLGLSSAMGQTTQPSAKAATAPASTPASGVASGASYRSTFDGYRRYTDQKVGPWREANDLVGRIGGWQAYAREGQSGEASGAAASASTPASAPAASSPHGAQSGQKKQ